MKRARGTLVVPALALLMTSGCDDARDSPSDRLPLAKVRVPSLRCGESVEQRGDCQTSDDCGAGQHCRLAPSANQPDRGPLTLSCGAATGELKSRERCLDGEQCESGLCALAGVCIEPCRTDRDCPTGQSCQPVETGLGAEKLAPVQACARTAAFAPDVELSVSEPVQLLAGRLNRVPIELPTRDSLLLLKADCGRTMRLQRLVARDDERSLFDIASLLNGDVQLNPVLNQGALIPLLIPNNPALALSSTGYDLGLTVDADSALAVVKASATQRHKRLILHVFYAGGGTDLEVGGIHPGDPRFIEVFDRLRARYAAIDIELQAVREYDVVGVLRDELSTLQLRQMRNDAGQLVHEVQGLDRLFALSAGIDDAGLSVFLVRSMGSVLGISGGIPGTIGIHGSALSGVAIALDRIPLEDADRAIFHELSHQQGLFHPVESDGLVIDPLADTPICSLQHDANDDGVLDSAECRERSGDNVMFWEGAGDTLSPQQVELLHRSLALY